MKNENILVSVIIPCYNQGQYIDEAVDSVLNQTFQNFEIIIINDGSTDPYTIDKLVNYPKAKCCIIHTKNNGLPSARNNGINVSCGKYILPLDADDKIGKQYLEKAVKILEERNNIGIVYCEAEFFGAKTGRWILPDFSIKNILSRNVIFCCAMFRKDDYLRTGGFNPNMKFGWEDWDLWLSIIEIGKEVYKIPDVLFYYRIKKDNSMINDLNQSAEKSIYSFKTIYINHFNFFFDNMGNPIELYSKLNSIILSCDYRFGRLIINTARKIKRTFFKTLNLFINSK